MKDWRKALLALACGLVSLSIGAANAQQPAGEAKDEAGQLLVATKCFQCHTDTMFRDGRQDRRAWEATIYRMVGRGALWTPDEIKLMADYLGDAQGPDAKPVTPAK